MVAAEGDKDEGWEVRSDLWDEWDVVDVEKRVCLAVQLQRG